MVKKLTNNIKISTVTRFNPDQSTPLNGVFYFDYFITIENNSDQPFQLLRRHWDILDSIGQQYAVDGEGVVGQQPIILPNEKYNYQSACRLRSDVGMMKGKYLFKNLNEENLFEVEIDPFRFITPYRLN
jgi:ApaG protein